MAPKTTGPARHADRTPTRSTPADVHGPDAQCKLCEKAARRSKMRTCRPHAEFAPPTESARSANRRDSHFHSTIHDANELRVGRRDRRPRARPRVPRAEDDE